MKRGALLLYKSIDIFKCFYIIDSMENSKTVTVLKSLADDTRLSVVRKLARDGCEVASKDIISDCALALELSQPTMSHHLQKLVSAGVIKERKSGVEKYYQLDTDLLQSLGLDITKL